MQEVARKFEAEYIKDSDGLNVMAPTVRCLLYTSRCV